jgi:RNA polymerase sigma-70 factor (ECF subfamily)
MRTTQPSTVREFEQVVYDNRERIYRAACMLLDNDAEAEDLTQSVFVQAWRGWERFEGRSQAYTWLYRILLRAYRRQQRRRWWLVTRSFVNNSSEHETVNQLVDNQPPPDVSARRKDDCSEVRTVMRGMSPKLREVLVLRYTEDWSVDQIAAALGIPTGTVKSRLNFAQQIVAERLRSRGWK